MEATVTDQAPTPSGSYSQAVRSGPILTLAGQAGLDPATRTIVGPGIVEQTEQALRNLTSVLAAAGSGWSEVVSVRVYLSDIADRDAVNRVYEGFVGDPAPARTTISCGLPPGLLVEIDCWAVVGTVGSDA